MACSRCSQCVDSALKLLLFPDSPGQSVSSHFVLMPISVIRTPLTSSVTGWNIEPYSNVVTLDPKYLQAHGQELMPEAVVGLAACVLCYSGFVPAPIDLGAASADTGWVALGSCRLENRPRAGFQEPPWSLHSSLHTSGTSAAARLSDRSCQAVLLQPAGCLVAAARLSCGSCQAVWYSCQAVRFPPPNCQIAAARLSDGSCQAV